MHPNPVFRKATRDQNLAFARARGFGQLSVNGGFGPLAAHVPFVLDDSDTWVYLHLVRSNPILDALDQSLPALLAVTGPDAYVSPDWYGLEDQAPTWNYVAVHLRGPLERLAGEELGPVLDRLSDTFESRLAPKPHWTAGKMNPDVRARLMRAIVPLRMRVEAVEGSWKLSQNKPESARLAAADALAGSIGQEMAALAGLMRELARDGQDSVDSSAAKP